MDLININHLLQLVLSDISSNNFKPVFLAECQLLELLESKPNLDDVDLNLLSETLLLVLKYPNQYSVKFAEKSLAYLKENNLLSLSDRLSILDNFLQTARQVIFESNNLFYGIDLFELYLKYIPDAPEVLKDLFWYYCYTKQNNKALLTSKNYYQLSKTRSEKIFSSYQSLYLQMRTSDWLTLTEDYQAYKSLIKTWLAEGSQIQENYLQESFIIVGQPLLYFEDNPQQLRLLQNQIATAFQNTLNQSRETTLHIKKSKEKKLKIAYIASTFKKHSVGWLARWLFKYHNRDNFQITIYLIGNSPDEFTKQWFLPQVDFLYYFKSGSNSVIQKIQEDQIDILIDLDSFSVDLTCSVLAAKPAPIQLTWLGLDASGLPSCDYFIADNYVLPENAVDYYQEKIWRLPHSYLAIDGFEVAAPNRFRDELNINPEAIVYLLVQGGFKRHPDNIKIMMDIIKSVENSFLLIKGPGDEKITQELYTTIAHQQGVSSERLRFLPLDKTEELHRANLAIADVVLDTYPYNGATTTLEVLWLGIPMVTRVGEQFAARNSYTFMMNVGVTEGIAFSDTEYVEWGVKFGKDPSLREQVQAKLRKSLTSSPLWNGKKFTQEMEKAYEQMWDIYQKNI